MSVWPTGDILFYNFHPPDDVLLFTTPGAAVKRWDDSVLVFDVRIGEGILRNYSFTARWFEVNCTFDLDGRLRPEAGPVNWAFNCDICTPNIVRGNEVYNVDLCFDVLVDPDGVTFALIDEDDFAEAQAQGWLTAAELAGARRGVDDLTDIIRDSGLRPFLERIQPFDSVLDSVPQGPPRNLTVGHVPQFQLDERLRLWPDPDAQNRRDDAQELSASVLEYADAEPVLIQFTGESLASPAAVSRSVSGSSQRVRPQTLVSPRAVHLLRGLRVHP